MNVLGVTFDSKLNWDLHVTVTISKAKRKIYALKMLKKFFRPNEMRILLDSYFYSTLYYNSVIWLTPNLSSQSKQNLLSVSANALWTCMMYGNNEISFENIHKLCKKCTPKQITMYQMSLKLHKLLNDVFIECSMEHVRILNQIVCTQRQLVFKMFKSNNYKIGLNSTANKLYPLNGLISLDSLPFGYVHFKKLMKIQFLKNGKT